VGEENAKVEVEVKEQAGGEKESEMKEKDSLLHTALIPKR
jgi:hypothetical protein